MTDRMRLFSGALADTGWLEVAAGVPLPIGTIWGSDFDGDELVDPWSLTTYFVQRVRPLGEKKRPSAPTDPLMSPTNWLPAVCTACNGPWRAYLGVCWIPRKPRAPLAGRRDRRGHRGAVRVAVAEELDGGLALRLGLRARRVRRRTWPSPSPRPW